MTYSHASELPSKTKVDQLSRQEETKKISHTHAHRDHTLQLLFLSPLLL